MFIPIPGNNDDKGHFSEKPIPSAVPSGQAAGANTPRGEELFNYIVDCLEHGSSRADEIQAANQIRSRKLSPSMTTASPTKPISTRWKT